MDETYMRRALALAEKGRGFVSPNPLVGAVLVKDGRVIGEGWHQKAGGPHAEVYAVRSAAEPVRGATAYVTLEPCSHQGRTPPCADLLIREGVARVVVGCLDPNPAVAGAGVQKLRDAGISVTCGVMEDECRALNPIFFHYITHKTPFVVLKTAMSLDGKIAAVSGESQWITGEASRADVQELRHALKGILVGVGTVLQDDPRLTCRKEGGVSPVRIVVDSHLRTPLSARVLQDLDKAPTWFAAVPDAAPEKQEALRQKGARVLLCRERGGRVDLQDLMKQLGAREIDSLLLEGGGEIHASALEQGIVHRVIAYIAPKILGGKDAKTPVEGKGFFHLADACRLRHMRAQPIGEDIKIVADVVPRGEG